MIINNQDEFLNWIETPSVDNNFYEATNYIIELDVLLRIENITIQNLNLDLKYFSSTEFINCEFINCHFYHTFFNNCILTKCYFKNCDFSWSKFIDVDIEETQFETCRVIGLEFADVNAKKLLFINCGELLDLKFGGGQGRDVSFINSFVGYMIVEFDKSKIQEKWYFRDTIVQGCNFNKVVFLNSQFESCVLSSNHFSDCLIGNQLLSNNNSTPSGEYNFIDIRSIIKSTTITANVLQDIFGIPSPEIKDYLHGLIFEVEFQSIFISYSFKDKEFAELINSELMRRGVITFLWEKDAPGGKKLKDIMSTNVKAKDRVLFIASSNSLKSEACHFELTEGRNKQEETWENVLFPIHVDSFLFDVKKENIRPVQVQQEYWANISELRNLNSISFIDCKSPITDKILFEEQIFKLVMGLRKTNSKINTK